MTEKKTPPSDILILSTSLNPESKSRIMAREAERAVQALGATTRFIDLQDYPLPMCDGGAAYADPRLPELAEAISGASAILAATAVYNYDVNAALKNLVELTGKAWEGRIAGFLCAAGGMSSYMSVMAFANSLQLDFRTLVIPRFVYASKGDFDGGRIASAKIEERIAQLASEAVRLGAALGGIGSAV